MDGVLVDSEPLILEAAFMMFAEHGLKMKKEDFLPFVGTGEENALGGVARNYNFEIDTRQAKKRTYDIYLDIIKGRLRLLPGAFEFINKCRQMKKKIAMATSADMRKVEGNFREVNFSFEMFDAIITAEDVVHKKPAPDIFIKAARDMGLDPEECLVVEDAVNGIEAAKKAGAKCLALTTSFSKEKLSRADWIAPDLSSTDEQVLNWN